MGFVVLPHDGVRRGDAVARVADGFAAIVDAEGEAVEIVRQQGKRVDVAPVSPQRGQGDAIIDDERWAGGVEGAVFGKADRLSKIIDGAGLAVIAAEGRERAHAEESPNKWNAGKVRAEAANVFAVGIHLSCFGLADGFPKIVDPAPVDPAIGAGFAQRAQVDVDSEGVDHRAAPGDGRKQTGLGRVHGAVHVLRPALSVEAHAHAEVIFGVVNALIDDLVARLSERGAETAQNDYGSPRYPKLSQA